MDPFVDIHGHSPSRQGGPPTLLCVEPEAAIALPPGSIACTAIHPWRCAAPGSEDAFRLVAEAARSKSVSAIGETGVDRIRRSAPIDLQLDAFRRHAELSEETRLPLVIHSVRANSDISSMFAEIRPASRWIIHGFRAGPLEAERILSKGIMVSLGTRELARPGAKDLLRRIPTNLLFFESDDSGLPVEDAYKLAATILECGVEELASRILANWNRLFEA